VCFVANGYSLLTVIINTLYTYSQNNGVPFIAVNTFTVIHRMQCHNIITARPSGRHRQTSLTTKEWSPCSRCRHSAPTQQSREADTSPKKRPIKIHVISTCAKFVWWLQLYTYLKCVRVETIVLSVVLTRVGDMSSSRPSPHGRHWLVTCHLKQKVKPLVIVVVRDIMHSPQQSIIANESNSATISTFTIVQDIFTQLVSGSPWLDRFP